MIKKAAITKAKVDDVANALDNLPEVTPEKHTLTIREAVNLLKPQITDLRQKGYTVEQIAEELSKAGISVKASTLKLYIKGTTKAKTKKTARQTHSATPLHTSTQTKTATEQATQKETKPATPAVASKTAEKGKFTPTADTNDI